MSNLELIDIVSMDPNFWGRPTPEVLKCFQIRVLRDTADGTLHLSLDFCTQSMLQSKHLSPDELEGHIQSLQCGLALGHAAAGYKKVGDTWVPHKQHFHSREQT